MTFECNFQVSVRGASGTIYQVIITLSILLSQLFGLTYLLGTRQLWPLLLSLTAFPAILQLILLQFCPESPSYLAVVLKDQEKAKQSLQWLRKGGHEVIKDELADLQLEAEGQQDVSIKTLLCTASLRRPLIIGVMMMFAQQLTGINAVIFYSTNVFKTAGLTFDHAQEATIGLGAANFVMALLTVFIVDAAGRKVLMLLGMGGMAVSMLVLFMCLMFKWISPMVSVFSLILYIVFFAIGPGPIPWLILPELVPHAARNATVAIAVSTNWIVNFAVSWAFQPLVNMIGPFVFLIFILITGCFIFYVRHFVPETKGKTVAQIQAIFQ